MLLLASVSAGQPNTCQPRSAHPFQPIYHIIGNVTSDASGTVKSVEDINDVSSAILYKGVYHVFHQCCQNHWDHVVSKDLIHWTRLPPPIVPGFNPTGVPHADWYDAHGSWDGALSIPHEWNGILEPVIIMTAIEGAKPHAPPPPPYTTTLAVVRPTDPSDPFLLNWTKDAKNPVQFISGELTTPNDTPGQVWKNGDHYNFLIDGRRYTTKDPSFHTWGVASVKFADFGEQGGQWFSPLARLANGSAPPASAPGWMMNVGGGNVYAIGDYHRENETWTTVQRASIIDHGPDASWMVGQFAGGRFLNIGWMKHGPPMLAESADHASADTDFRRRARIRHPAAEFLAEALHAPVPSPPGCSFTTHWEVFPLFTNIYNREPSPTNVTHGTLKFVGLFESADACFAAVNHSTEGPFHSWTYNDASVPPPYGKHCWADTSFTWQNRGGAKGQVSGRGPGFPLAPALPSSFTNHHLTGLREVAYDPMLGYLVSNPIAELANLRNATIASEQVVVAPSKTHIVAGTGWPVDASTSDVVITVDVPAIGAGEVSAAGVRVLANVTQDAGSAFGGILTVVNFTAPNANGTMQAVASVRTLDPCGVESGSSGLSTATFPILPGERMLDLRLLIDRSTVEVFIMKGRVVFSATYNPSVLYVPDTHIALHTWGSVATNISLDVFSMECGWTDPPYQPDPRGAFGEHHGNSM
jgi:sucrose-6-phosphate hydrolase SacC (GH32 family)